MDEGDCKAHIPMFYYDPKDMKCKSFIYGGCGGNDNRFETEKQCMTTCASKVKE